MTRLILIRHGKSSWDDPFGDDHARTLNHRGRDAAKAVGAWLQSMGYIPDLMLVSDAVRTVETSNLILPAFEAAPTVKFKPSLYQASPGTILDLVRREDASCIAVIAHNPGMGMLANGLVKKRPAHPRFDDYPTCATTIIDFDGVIGRSQGEIVDFTVPRDLIGTAGCETD